MILLTAGYYKIVLKYKNGHKEPIETIINQTRYFWPLIGSTILISLAVVLGLVALIIPGIYLMLRYMFAQVFIIDKNQGVLESMKNSAKITDGVKWQLLLFNLISLGVIVLGALAFGIGLLVAVPMVYLAMIHVYRQLA
jgi:uncharacterized membrane protein